ncbi:MAG: ComEC/Rec2 family competence protein, partial [Actinomycetota bacterium]|nr:ComEC/Rec2 family competence protein [Actinomycetota bacterium]
GAIVLALAACAGAWWSAGVPLAPALGAVLLALALRRPVLLIVATALLASALGTRAWAGLAPPVDTQVVAAEVVLLTDPVEVRGATKVDIGLGDRRVEAWARGRAAAVLRPLLAGERVVVEGRLRPPPPEARRWLARRHVSARLNVDEAGAWRPGNLASRTANGLRRTLVAGARPLATEPRALLTGMVFGDDRDQSVAVADDFRAAGLTHLLAVSGQNVAFVLVLAGPVLRRLGLRGRWAASLGVIAFFGVMTRWEPSVLRASAMAALAVTATGLGRPASRRRLLALAVAGVVLIDPLLVHSVGFQLSVGASAGILALAGPLTRRLPGPRWLAEALAVTLAAQIGVAPVLVPVFGGLPLASVPANLLAVPAAGPLMVWGLTAGLAAGVLGPPADAVLHLPTSWLLGWVAGVARWAAALPLGRIEAPHLVALVVVAVVVVLAGRRCPRVVLPVGALAATLVVLAPAVTGSAGEVLGVVPARGAELWRSGGVVLILDDPDGGALLEGLRDQGVERLDLVVARRGSSPLASTVLLLRSRLPVGMVLAPEDHRIRGAVVPVDGSVVEVGDLEIDVLGTKGTLEAEVHIRR